MDKLKPLTRSDMADLKEGIKLICIEGHGTVLKKGNIYLYGSFYVDHGNCYLNLLDKNGKLNDLSGWLPHRFAIKESDIDYLIRVSNKGRETANKLIDKYVGQFKIEDGEYKKL